MPTRRFPAMAAAALALAAVLSGCGPDLDAAELAGAECRSALSDELGLAENDTDLPVEFTVTGTGDGRHIEGGWRNASAGEGRYTCDVVADHGRMRGWRVTALDVERIG